MLREQYSEYLRSEELPSVWCPGCGNGIIVKALVNAIAALSLRRDDVVLVGGIGCSGRTPFILDFNTMHTTHGRALAFATGIKLARPELKVIVAMGDGDASAIGGNHFIHACRRNIDLAAIIFNNAIYGQTGGQLAPTTPQGKRSTTSLLGTIEPNFDLCKLALGAGAGFVARTTVFDFHELIETLTRALTHKGFSVVEALTPCPTYFGRMNDLREPYEMLHYLKDQTIPQALEDVPDEAAQMKRLPTGIFKDEQRMEYTELYSQLCKAAKGAAVSSSE
ncbi:MAG: 2-oxoacid:ferredoxin oxidoreductase subunit beta [Candidatus Fraserbacteria bacterium RBG_16_55_9]|uniref:2-oxoacid:ferredoxin oxidoreductase subunit beta n=1 Tax=Fraserbacteria sp. (strain RBG_16_55_9) TaxID=1817864 RepID=A0A1F5UTJ6_FRAXR|nr:MAG: 2-oxoacid:ferredoxin oxidoreductase subunit beta [Candidatus Fraserbacteria bacterium RBG_16_55_9]